MSAKANPTDDAPTETEFEQALATARTEARYDDTPADKTEFIFPEAHYNGDTLTGELVTWLSPSTVVAWTALREPDADEVDGAAPGDDAPRRARTFLLDGALDDGGEADADLVFRVAATFENSYGDERVVVETPAPWDVPDEFDGDDPNEAVKSLSWDDHHYTFDTDDRAAPPEASEAWTLDKSGAAPLREAAIEAGYEWAVEGGDGEADGDERDRLDDVLAFVEDGDRVSVRYAKKNGNGTNAYSGEVVSVATSFDSNGVGGPQGVRHRTGTDGLVFEDDEDKSKRVKRDDEGEPSLFSFGHYPYMGEALAVTVEPTTD